MTDKLSNQTDQRHEFVPHPDYPNICDARTESPDRCGQPREAECHVVEPQRYEHNEGYRDPICRNCGEYKGKHSKDDLFCIVRSDLERAIEIVKAKRDAAQRGADGAAASRRMTWNSQVELCDKIIAALKEGK